MGNSNVTGGILLLLIGAALVSVGVSEKGKRILNILTGSGSAPAPASDPDPVVHPGYIEEGNIRSGGADEPTTITVPGAMLSKAEKKSGSLFGFVGERAAIVI